MYEMDELKKTGHRGEATVTAVTTTYEIEQTGMRYLEVSATVQPSDGAAFSATFPMNVPKRLTPEVGTTLPVSFDPADRAMVRFRIGAEPGEASLAPRILWRVPTACPNCGAAVDQSRESAAQHPSCHMCNAPLPCEPVD